MLLVFFVYLIYALQDGRTALYYAAWKGHSEIVRILLEANAGIDIQEKVI